MATVAGKTPQRGIIGWLTRLADFANPILVKETRQALKSRQFVATFMLLLVASWIVSSFLLLNAGDQLEYRAVGGLFFFAYYLVLAFAVLAIVPFNAFRSLQAERELNTYDLLSITAMSPRQMVWGKLLSAVVQCLLYYSAITPFIAFSSLLQGFDLFQVLFLLIVTLAQSMLVSMIAIMLSSFAKTRQWTGLMAIMLLGSLFQLMMANIGLSQLVLRGRVPFEDTGFWVVLGIGLVAAISYFVLFLQIATAQLTFESDNRSTGIRITCSLQFVLIWAITFGLWAFRSQLSIPFRAMTALFDALPMFALAHVAFTGMVFATEGDFISSRVRRTIPGNFLLKGLSIPYWPGGSRGFIYLLLHLVATLVGLFVLTGLRNASPDVTWSQFASGTLTGELENWPQTWKIAALVACYCVIYIGAISFVSRLVQSLTSIIKAAHMRVVGLLMFLAGLLLPEIARALELVRMREFSVIDYANPARAISGVMRNDPTFEYAFWILGMTTAAVIIFNGRAITRGIFDILWSRKKSKSNVNLNLPPAISEASA